MFTVERCWLGYVKATSLASAGSLNQWLVQKIEAGLVTGQELVLLVIQRDDRESSLVDQRRARKDRTGFDIGQGLGSNDGLSRLDLHLRILRILVINRDHGSLTHRALLVPGVIDDQTITRLHVSQVFKRDWVRYSIPDRGLLTLQIVKGVGGGFGF
jgi:hypothetical protein